MKKLIIAFLLLVSLFTFGSHIENANVQQFADPPNPILPYSHSPDNGK